MALGMEYSSIGRDESDTRRVPAVFCYGQLKNNKVGVFITVIYLGYGFVLGLEHFQRINDLLIGCIDS